MQVSLSTKRSNWSLFKSLVTVRNMCFFSNEESFLSAPLNLFYFFFASSRNEVVGSFSNCSLLTKTMTARIHIITSCYMTLGMHLYDASFCVHILQFINISFYIMVMDVDGLVSYIVK